MRTRSRESQNNKLVISFGHRKFKNLPLLLLTKMYKTKISDKMVKNEKYKNQSYRLNKDKSKKKYHRNKYQQEMIISFNKILRRVRDKCPLLFQKCGMKKKIYGL